MLLQKIIITLFTTTMVWSMIKFIENRWWALTGHVSLGIIMGILIAKSRLVKFKKYNSFSIISDTYIFAWLA